MGHGTDVGASWRRNSSGKVTKKREKCKRKFRFSFAFEQLRRLSYAARKLLNFAFSSYYQYFSCEKFGGIAKKDYLCNKLLSSAILS
jgi:hypothetical protein